MSIELLPFNLGFTEALLDVINERYTPDHPLEAELMYIRATQINLSDLPLARMRVAIGDDTLELTRDEFVRYCSELRTTPDFAPIANQVAHELFCAAQALMRVPQLEDGTMDVRLDEQTLAELVVRHDRKTRSDHE